MLFHEMYSVYYQVVSKIIQAALEERLTAAELRRIAATDAFSETVLIVEPALRSGRWPLVDEEGGTPLRSVPERPLSLLERRWLKTIAMDPRIRLFGDLEWDEDVKPLFRPEDVVIYDRFGDGDPYESPNYREVFRVLLTALRTQQAVEIVYKTQRGAEQRRIYTPDHLEFSAKDDKFRLIICEAGKRRKMNLNRIRSVSLRGEGGAKQAAESRNRGEYILELTDERNALERAMLHFADLEKRTERIAEKQYRITLKYDMDDEPELLIRVLSFGPMLRVVAPEQFVSQIRSRIERQRVLKL